MFKSKKMPKIILLASWTIYTILNFFYVLLNKKNLFEGQTIDNKAITISIVTATLFISLAWIISVLIVRFFLNLVEKEKSSNIDFNFMFSIMIFVKSLSTILIKSKSYGMVAYIVICLALSVMTIIMSVNNKSISISNRKDLLKIIIIILGIFLI
ncbi:hypothetical protein [Pseudolactococcus raffinolactis]|uniref:hypothetical protein n=1 Tax=Pseudolactococcus raffinolactis TaxID=1366 RepID=UPI000BDF1976|nr:hypothetical protein [Lactococcus raffinolactis]QIW57243.1 hypothetical protein GU335_11370 [Lactococcus raffinolactis]